MSRLQAVNSKSAKAATGERIKNYTRPQLTFTAAENVHVRKLSATHTHFNTTVRKRVPVWL